ncbi:MAG: Sec-independent protein translocase protein TatB [Gammaproteobacteria bacterium]|nr:Sec-independent protein translocase protein TatB [Gammaproteobacteria bacterium]
MFDIGFSELVAVSLIALIVLGPKRLPEVARTAGRWIGQLRRFMTDVKQDLDREIHSEDLAELRKLKNELNDTRRMMQNTSGELVKGFTEINPEVSSPTIHSSETPALADSPLAPAGAARRRGKARNKTRSGKKHGGTRKTRRR